MFLYSLNITGSDSAGATSGTTARTRVWLGGVHRLVVPLGCAGVFLSAPLVHHGKSLEERSSIFISYSFDFWR